MSGTSGIFSTNITLVTYFDNAEGLRNGQPVDLQGVPIGNVQTVRVVPERQPYSVQVVMRINKRYQPLIREDSIATILTAGVLGEAFIDIDSTKAKEAMVKDGGELPHSNAPNIQDVVRSSQGTLQNLDVLVRRVDH